MASSCGSSYASSQETANFARICRIVVDVLRDILWQVLIHEIPAADLPNKVQANQNKLVNLDVKIKKWLCGISSSSPVIPIAENFDVTSLYTLIRNLCSHVPTPSTQWGKLPPPGGTNLGDDIERVREFRNNLYGHAKQAKIDTADFNNLFIDIRNVVGRFDAYFSSKAMKCDFQREIDTILTCSMDKTLQDTYVDKMKEIAVLSDDVENVKQQVCNLKHEVHDVKQQVGDVKQEVGDVKQQVGNVKQEVGDLKQAAGNVKQQVGNVEQEVDDVKQEVGYVKQQVGDVKQAVCDVELELCDVKQEFGNVMQEVGDVKQEIGDVKQDVGNVKQEVGDLKQAAGNINQQVGNVEQEIDDVKQEVGYVKQQVGDVKQEVCDVKQEINDVKQELCDVKQGVCIVMQEVVDVKQEVGDVKQDVGDLKQAAGNVKQQVGNVEQGVDDVKQEVGYVKEQVGDVKQEVCDVKQEIGNVKQELCDVKQGVGNVMQEVGDVKQETGEIKQELHDVKHEVGNVMQKVCDVKQEIGDVKQDVGNVKQEFCNVKHEVCDLKQTAGNVKQQVGNVEQEVGYVKQKVSNVKQQVGDVKQEVHDVKQEIGDVKQEVGNVKQEVGYVKQKVGDVKQDVDDVKQEVSDVKQDVDDVKQEVGGVKQKGEILQSQVDVVTREIEEIKETLKKKPDVEKGNIFGRDERKETLCPADTDLQTKEFMPVWRCICCPCFRSLNCDGSYQLISGDEISLQSFQVGEQMSSDRMEVSPVVEGYNDPEADIQEPVIPEEILRMDERSIQLFKEALRDGKEKVYNFRVMVVGQYGVGKTTLTKRLLGDDVNISQRKSTEGIDVHVHRCRVSRATGEWVKEDKDAEQSDKLQRYWKLLNDQGQRLDIGDEQVGNSKELNQMETAPDVKENDIQCMESTNVGTNQKRVESSSSKPSNVSYEHDSSIEDNKDLKASSKVMLGDKENSFGNIAKEELQQMLEQSLRNADKSDNEDTVKSILQFLNENAGKLVRSRQEYSPLAMWDFAGQYVFYTTHQTFLTHRAIYLLVIDLSQQPTDKVEDDDCFFDIEGIKECQVHDLVELWLNSIHSCAPFPESHNPPVILVGTHMDKVPKDIRQERYENVFRKIRSHNLRGRQARFHLADQDFSIDNTFNDPMLKDLQKKIVELASKQPHWGESIPGRWLLLEEGLMSLKAKHIKVIPYHVLEKMNQEGDVKIESKEELDLFLKFQHDIGNILYFRTEELRKWIILEPQWLIKAMRSLITSEMFILRKHPQAEKEWHQFKEEGKLTQTLLDIIWSKEHDPDLYDYKKLILMLMEQLDIIVRPRLSPKDGDKAEDFLLAPCMLRKTTPREVISPKVKPNMESSSVLCFVFTEKFLPSPIFHRLLAVCVAKWPILKKRGTNQIFCGSCVFEINHLYRLTLYFKSYVIFARVTLAAAKYQTLDAKVCIPIREFINDNLSKILGSLSQSLTFELFLQCQCPESVGDCLDSMISVKELNNIAELCCRYHDDHIVESNSLLKYWFENEENNSEDRSVVHGDEDDTARSGSEADDEDNDDGNNDEDDEVEEDVDEEGDEEHSGEEIFSSLPHYQQDEKLPERQLGQVSLKLGHESLR